MNAKPLGDNEADRDGEYILNSHGDPVGFLHRGSNGEWYGVPIANVAHAYPVGSLDNIKGTGFATPDAALAAWWLSDPTTTELTDDQQADTAWRQDG